MCARLTLVALALALLAGCASGADREQIAQQRSPRGPAYSAGSAAPMTGSFVGATGGAAVSTFIKR